MIHTTILATLALTSLTGVTAQTVTGLTEAIPTAAAPTNVQQLNSGLAAIYTNASGKSLPDLAAAQVAAGLGDPSTASTGTGFGAAVSNLLGSDPLLPFGENSVSNINLRAPARPIFPKKAPTDAPYSLSEAQLRAAIYIPPGFTYGRKPPTIFVPGTGAYGGINFGSNLRKLLTNVPYADPVWVNIPGANLGDVQVTSEYVAYAINYISGISQAKNVSVVSWSQGGLNTQWAFTFWPSTRGVVSDFIPVSGDFRGTVLASALCLSPGGADALQAPYCAPAFQQQEANSALIAAFQRRGGGSAYVPTTSLWSGFFDEIVQPQSGASASAFLQGAAGLVTNNEYQKMCPEGSRGAGFYGHAIALYHPLAYALVVDALTHDGPGLVGRLDLESVCAVDSAPGLTVGDNLQTANLIPLALVLDLLYQPKMLQEPPLKAYVTQ